MLCFCINYVAQSADIIQVDSILKCFYLLVPECLLSYDHFEGKDAALKLKLPTSFGFHGECSPGLVNAAN